ncbi:HNH endonuclease family protein [Streptomyces sp. KL2]|uniref:HNH endonuclease family protein n=1 Tax=Streptomyces sp. KL2 TaxID=3050126 RepID=UPI00397E1B7C
MRSVLRVGLAAAALVALAAPAHAVPAAEEFTVPLREVVAALPVAAEDRTGYDRDAFRHWIDADRDGCSTRAEVLRDEAVDPPAVTGRCTLSGGRWHSWYDDTYLTGPRGLDIDHLVPLAEAWDSGARSWSAQQREAYANDLGDPRALVAVTARSNRSKADRDVAEWLPDPAVVCHYIGDWAAIKLRWNLSVDPAERDRLTGLAADCPNVPVHITKAG